MTMQNHNKMRLGKYVIDVEEWEYYIYIKLLKDKRELAYLSISIKE